ncbi:MAG: hypothetical protein ABIZ91_17700 [Gemmatimonadaceae bacterium]
MAEILIIAHGMGHSRPGDGYTWASLLYPTAEQFTKDTRRWLQFPDGRQKYLLEVFYEDVNETLRNKYSQLWDGVTGQLPEQCRSMVDTCITDVTQNVLLDHSIDLVQSRFVAKYLEARELAQALAGPEVAPTAVPIGVLAHSLGTLIAYEGLFRAADVASAFALHPVRLVVCAPMWSPICKVQAALKRRRYLPLQGLVKPGRVNRATRKFEPLISRCTAIYHTSDPFLLIQDRAEYMQGSANNGLIDEFVLVESGNLPLPASHAMGSSYLTHPDSRAAVLRGLGA